jgi:hypothetical protein
VFRVQRQNFKLGIPTSTKKKIKSIDIPQNRLVSEGRSLESMPKGRLFVFFFGCNQQK